MSAGKYRILLRSIYQACQFISGRKSPALTVAQLKEHLRRHFPAFDQLVSLAIAVNGEYADDSRPLSDKDEIVLIPPVSGG